MEAKEDFEEKGGDEMHVVPCINDRHCLPLHFLCVAALAQYTRASGIKKLARTHNIKRFTIPRFPPKFSPMGLLH